MEYDAEPVERNFGKGVSISHGGHNHEQLSCRDGLVVRIFKQDTKRVESGYDTKTVPDPDYHGIIFRPAFKGSEQDYQLFKDLTERLTQVSGEEIKSSQSDFMNYISHRGLEQELPRIGATVRFNLKDTQEYPENVESWLNSIGHKGGLISDLVGYAAGFWLLSQFKYELLMQNGVTRNEAPFVYAIYGIGGPFLEGIIGAAAADSVGTWCGPIHAIGFIPAKMIAKRQFGNPNYILNKFMKNYGKLDAMRSNVGNQKVFARVSKELDRYYGIIEDMFTYTQFQRGFSIACDSPDRQHIIDLFSYVLDGGTVPQLTAHNRAKPQQSAEKEQIGTEPGQTDFINPWGIEIPRLGDKK